MKITVIGAGAMGGLFASKLSAENEVTLIDLNKALIDKINNDGLILFEGDTPTTYRIKGRTSSEGMEKQDLVILFVKAMFSRSALDSNRNIIGEKTYLLTMQNGMGHEDLLNEYADEDHVLLGTTQHNASVKSLGVNIHGGSGPSAISAMSGNNDKDVEAIANTLTACGIECHVTSDVKRMIWQKLFTNISASVLTAILQKPLGYISSDEYAWTLCKKLIKEAVDVAKADGYDFDYEAKCNEVKQVCDNSPEGLTSIYSDIANKRKTEVDTISGAVARKAKKLKVNVPYTEYSVTLIHALENR